MTMRKRTKEELTKAQVKRSADSAKRFKRAQQIPKTMATVIVGGCANGMLINDMRSDAEWIELARPDYIRPLESAFQKNPEVAKKTNKYEVHPIALQNSEDTRGHIFGIAVVEGKTLTWAFSQLVIGFVENVTNQLLAEGLIEKQ